MINKQLINSFIQQNTDKSWFNLLSNIESLHKAIYDVVSLSKTQSIEPKLPNMLNAFKYCSLDNLKCIILAMDPYPQSGVATGIAFANKDKVYSPSLKIIQEELGEITDPSLINWCKQGVLLLNSSLTVESEHIGSHYKIWEDFMVDLIKELSKQDYIWVLMGSRAKSFSYCINKGDIIKTYHPAADTYGNERKFRGSGVFKKIDEKLSIKGLEINWLSKIEELV